MRQIFGICFITIFFGAGIYWSASEQTTTRTTTDPHVQRKMDRIKHGNPRAGFPGEAMAWFMEQRSTPTGSIPEGWKERALDHIAVHNRGTGESVLSWTALGPNNIGGRIRAIAVDPGNASILYAGSVSGGVFKSTNAGSSWSPTDDFAANLAISTIVVDPTNSNIVYAGTGEGFFNIDAVRGAGVLKSTNGGSSWTLQTSFSGGVGGYPYYINSLYIRPDNAQELFAATNSGLFRTTNGGTSWTFIHQGGTSARATQIVPHPTTAATFFVAYGNFSTDGIYKTTNGGTSFTKLTTGLPTSGYQRISLAIAPSNGNTLYATFTALNYTTRGIFRTTNGGTSWDSVATPMDAVGGGTHLGFQGWYNNVLGVSPTDPNTVYAGGINLYKSTNAGSSWTMLSNWYSGAGFPYVHADQHAIVFSGSTIWFGNDGGVWRTINAGTSFTEHVSGLATLQFYSGAVHPTSATYYGGTQDNGSVRATSAPTWSVVLGGDGGSMEVDFLTPTTVYTEYVYLNFQKSVNSGGTWTRMMSGIPTSGPGQFDGTSDRCLFIAPFAMDPSNSLNIVAGTYRVYRTTNGATLWSSISGDLTGDGTGGAGGKISTVAIAKTSSNTIYIGTSGGGASATRIQVTTDAGGSWTNITSVPLPNRYVTRIVIDPTNANRAWALYSGYDGNTPATPGHVFLTTNRGVLWTNASGNLPDVPVNCGVVNPGNTSNVIIGTDLGVFETTNGGLTWTQQNSGMANVVVSDLDVRASDNFLFAATHGRGMFRTTSPLTDVPDNGFTVADEFRLLQNYPNPFNPSTTIPFSLSERNRVTVSVYDLSGRSVATLMDGEMTGGSHSLVFDASGLASGMYMYEVKAGSRVAREKMLLLR